MADIPLDFVDLQDDLGDHGFGDCGPDCNSRRVTAFVDIPGQDNLPPLSRLEKFAFSESILTRAHSEGRADGAESPVALLVRESRSQSPVAFSESLVPAVVHCLTDPNNQLKLRLPAAVRVARLDCAAEPEHKPTGGLDGVSASAPSLPLPSDAPTSFILERALLCDQDITEHEMLGTLILNELKSLSALQSDRDQDVAFFATKEPKQQDVLGATVLKKQS